MSCEDTRPEVCREGFDVIFEKLDRLDEAIRGNGKPGILRRLDRLEAMEAARSRVLWMVFGALLAFGGLVAAAWLFGPGVVV